jgi:hypothetical protein
MLKANSTGVVVLFEYILPQQSQRHCCCRSCCYSEVSSLLGGRREAFQKQHADNGRWRLLWPGCGQRATSGKEKRLAVHTLLHSSWKKSLIKREVFLLFDTLLRHSCLLYAFVFQPPPALVVCCLCVVGGRE